MTSCQKIPDILVLLVDSVVPVVSKFSCMVVFPRMFVMSDGKTSSTVIARNIRNSIVGLAQTDQTQTPSRSTTRAEAHSGPRASPRFYRMPVSVP